MMTLFSRPSSPMRHAVAPLLAGLALLLGSCGGAASSAGGGSNAPSSNAMALGLVSSSEGYTFASKIASMQPGSSQPYSFQIVGPGNAPVTSFLVSETKLLHFYAIRGDLTGFNHIHPTVAPDGTWTTTQDEPLMLQPGPYRVFIQFETKDDQGLVRGLLLSRTLQVPGAYTPAPLAPPSKTSEVDGYTITITQPDATGAMTAHFTYGGQPVTNLQPYLGSYAHLSAFQVGDLGFGHLHPLNTPGQAGPDLLFHAHFRTGTFRMFLQFQTDGVLHTAPFTVHVG
jgi:hypothetical protein